MLPTKYVILGNGVAGTKAAQTLRHIDQQSEITIISSEDTLAYSKVLLTDYIADKVSKTELFIRDKDFYKSLRINLLLSTKVKKVLPEEHKILIEEQGRRKFIQYNKLLVATGSSPKFPDIPGIELKGVFGLNTLNDAEKIKLSIEKQNSTPLNIVIVGGGLIGCKVASVLSGLSSAAKKYNITVVVSSAQLLSQMLDKKSAGIVLNAAKRYGIKVKFKTDVVEILPNKSQVNAVKLSDGKILPAEIVIIAKGVKPNVDFLIGTNIRINHGVLVNDKLQTLFTDIYAAGDVAEAYDYVRKEYRVNATWPNAVRQGEVAALNMSGKDTIYEGSFSINTGDFFGLTAASIGNLRSPLCKNGHCSKEFYEKFFFDKDDNFTGYVCVSASGMIHKLRTVGFLSTILNKKLTNLYSVFYTA